MGGDATRWPTNFEGGGGKLAAVRRLLKSLLPGLCGVALVLGGGSAWAYARFGSLNHLWLYANGVRVYLENPTVVFPDSRPGEERTAEFMVRNLSSAPVRVLGVKVSCGCISTAELPVTVPPGGAQSLRLMLHFDKSPTGTVAQTATYHTDEPTAPDLVAQVSARVVDSSSVSSPAVAHP